MQSKLYKKSSAQRFLFCPFQETLSICRKSLVYEYISVSIGYSFDSYLLFYLIVRWDDKFFILSSQFNPFHTVLGIQVKKDNHFLYRIEIGRNGIGIIN